MPHFRIVPSLSLEQRCLVSHCTISVALLTYSSVPAASKKHSGELPEHLSNVQAVEERQSADRQIDVLIRPEQMPEIAFKGSPPGNPDSHDREHPGRPVGMSIDALRRRRPAARHGAPKRRI